MFFCRRKTYLQICESAKLYVDFQFQNLPLGISVIQFMQPFFFYIQHLYIYIYIYIIYRFFIILCIFCPHITDDSIFHKSNGIQKGYSKMLGLFHFFAYFSSLDQVFFCSRRIDPDFVEINPDQCKKLIGFSTLIYLPLVRRRSTRRR